jgi:endoglycosylceramidase
VIGARVLAGVIAVGGVVACGDNEPAPCGGDAYRACGAFVRDPEGRAVILRGVNLAGAHKMPPYTDVFTPDDYARLHAWGFRTLRFLIMWEAIEPQPGVYDDAYLDWVRERMQWAEAAGLTVVLDMHQDVYGGGFGFGGAPRWTCDSAHYDAFVPNTNWILNYVDPNVQACYDKLYTTPALVDAFAAMWGHVAMRLAGEPAIIGFDPMNEPHWGTYAVPMFEVDRLQPFYAKAIDKIRAQAPSWIAFVEPAASRNLGFATKMHPFADQGIDNAVYAPHMYDPNAELNGGFSTTNRETLLSTALDLRADADYLGAPLWIGEYGGRAESPTIAPYMDAAYDGAAAQLAGTMYWAYDRSNGGYGMLDPDGNEQTALVDAIVRPYPARIAGEPLTWTYDDATRTLDVTWKRDASIDPPTLIVTPTRVYGSGVSVDTDGTVELRDGEVAITGGTRATITPR